MMNLLLISELNLKGCLQCASIVENLGNSHGLAVSFLPENDVLQLIGEINEFDFIVLIGYNVKLLNKKRLTCLKDKLMLLTPHNGEIVPNFINQKSGQNKPNFDEENLELINNVVNIVNGRTEENLFSEPTDGKVLTVEETIISTVELMFYLTNRYERGLKVIDTLYSIDEDIDFHNYFFAELVNKQETEGVNIFLKKYVKMAKETKKLISYIRILGNSGFVLTRNEYFFEDEIFDLAEKRGYPSMVIEYRQSNGKYITIYHERGADSVNFFPGKIKTNWNKTIAVKMN